MIIEIIPKTKRAKDRVAQHGSKMELVKKGKFRNQRAILVKSLKRTSFNNQHWHGWFTEDEIEMMALW